MEYRKITETEFTATEHKEEVKKYRISDLKNDKAIYLQHVAEYQAKADAVDVLLTQAADLGVV